MNIGLIYKINVRYVKEHVSKYETHTHTSCICAELDLLHFTIM